MWKKLQGKKTYAVAVIMLVYAVAVEGFFKNDWNSAGQIILQALGLAGLRNAM